MSFAIHVSNRADVAVNTSKYMAFPRWFSFQLPGGPDEMELEIVADVEDLWPLLDWLRYNIRVLNDKGTEVWWGLIQTVEVVTPSVVVGLTLDEMVNRLKVDYTFDNSNGEQESGATDWAQDSWSVDRFGKFEERVPFNTSSVADAEGKRDTWLASEPRVSLPTPTMEFGRLEKVYARLYCIGKWKTLRQMFWAREDGRLLHDVTPSGEHMLGFVRTAANKIGFNLHGIHDLDAYLRKIPSDTKVVVTGSASNNTTYTAERVEDIDDTVDSAVKILTSTTVWFRAQDDLYRSDGGLESFHMAQMIKIAGASNGANNGYAWIAKEGSNWVEVTGHGGDFSNEDEGATVTLTSGRQLYTTEAVVFEAPSASSVSVTTSGTKIAQKFVAPGTWDLAEVLVYAKCTGAPADNLRLAIYSDSSGVPGTSLASGTLSISSIGTDMSWHEWDLSPWPRITQGTSYWIVLDRTGSAAVDAWSVGIELEATYSAGDLKIWNGSSWVDRWTDASIPFQIFGKRETSGQIADIVAPANCGQHFVDTLYVRTTGSGVYTRLYRDGLGRADREIEELLNQGTDTHQRMTCWVTSEGRVILDAEDGLWPGTDQVIYNVFNGQLRTGTGREWEEGVLPVGHWVYLEGVGHPSLDRVFVGRATYNADEGSILIEAARRSLPWSV